MRCPKCDSEDIKVLDTRPGKNESSIRRRRQCINCTHKFSTVEEILREDLIVIKRDGSHEEFDRSKLLRGILKATEKRPINARFIENLVQQVILSIQSKYDTEVPSHVVGEEIMSRLKKLDQIAYVRFASVYKDFHDISQLAQEIHALRT